MVCENGWSQREELGADGTVHDAKRIDYIREHVASMSQAIDEGVDLIGYTYWSFVDILSSSDGMGKRYGLVYVDREDFEGSVTVGDLKKHGDTGIGTFDGLNGELVMLDGEVWQAAGDGSVNLMEDAATIPFGNVTFLDSDETLDVSGVESFEALLKQLDGRVAELGTNIFYAARIDGTFDKMNVRSEYKQEKPYPTIVDALAADQTFFDLEEVEGSMVGVYCPPYMASLNSAGWHFHFVTADRKQGGHVLDCAINKATATIDKTKEFDLALPGSQKFESTDFTVDRSADVKKAETNE
jgi:acetolactate decarboxylase